MCGISGFTFNDEKLLKQMMALQQHRGPDQDGFFINDEISLGHNRLSIIDLSERGRQPMWDTNHSVAVIFNGEIYNFKEIKKDLEKKYKFFSATDTEVIIYGYKEYGYRVFDMLKGMWSIVLYDSQNKKLILSRDYAGIKPLYYINHGNNLYFASEVRALKEVGVPNVVDEKTLTTFLSFGFVPSPYSVFYNIKKLLPGEIITYDLSNKSLSSRFVGINNSNLEMQESEILENAKKIFSASIRRHMIADVPIGLFLSGGIDSSLIAAFLKKEGFSIPAFCLDFEGKNDAFFARRVAEHLKIPLRIQKVSINDIESIYEDVWQDIKEPLADTAIFSAYLISKIAKENGVKVVLSGEGGDELFGGYVTHQWMEKIRHPKWLKYNMIDNILHQAPDFLGKKRLADYFYLLSSDAIGLYMNNLATAYLYDYKAARIYFDKLHSTNPMLYDFFSYLPDRLLYKLDSSTMHYSIEGRVPFLDKDLIEFSMNQSLAGLNKKYGAKWLVRSMLQDCFSEDLFSRRKEGFSIPLGAYFDKMPLFNEDYKKATKWLNNNTELDINNIVVAKGKTKFNIVALYRALV